MRTVLATFSTGDTQSLIYIWFTAAVHFHFASTGTASHTKVFKSTAKTGGFMSLKMV